MTVAGWTRCMLFACGVVGVVPGTARAEQAPVVFDDSRRLYFSVDTGFHHTFDRQFAGDVNIEPSSGVDWDLGGSVGYNINRNWGVELQALGIDPDLNSSSHGTIREFSVFNIVPAARYRWHWMNDRLVPYVTGGVGLSFSDIHDQADRFATASTSSTTVVGSLSAGIDYFLSQNIAFGVENRWMIHPGQDATVTYTNPQTGAVTRFDNTLNLNSVSFLAHLKLFPGQAPGADGSGRTFFLADHGPFDTDQRRVYLSGLFGYDFLWDRGGGAGVRFRDKGGDANLTKGGALGLNWNGHWATEVQLLVTPLNVRLESGPKFAKLNVLEVLPTVRYRWQFCQGRLVPFVTAGLGASYLTGNDARPLLETQNGQTVQVVPHYEVDSPSLVGSVSAGVEYFLNHNLSVGLDVPFHFYPDQDSEIRRAGHPTGTGTANFSGMLALLQLKAYLP